MRLEWIITIAVLSVSSIFISEVHTRLSVHDSTGICKLVKQYGLCEKLTYADKCKRSCRAQDDVESENDEVEFLNSQEDDGCTDKFMLRCHFFELRDYCSRRSRYYRYMVKNCKRSCRLCADGGLVNSPNCGRTFNKRVVGGSEAVAHSSPWMAMIAKKRSASTSHCGGALITNQWVLSAAHCFTTPANRKGSNFVVKFGEHDVSTNKGREVTAYVDKIVVQESFNANTYDNDIALLRLKEPVKLTSTVGTVCLPTAPGVTVGKMCQVTGWGQLGEDLRRSKKLQEAKVPLVSWRTCRKALAKENEVLTTNQFCAGHAKGGIDSCTGDSGGPLTCGDRNSKRYLTGIVSWGLGCGRPGLYGVYTNVALYRGWIASIIN